MTPAKRLLWQTVSAAEPDRQYWHHPQTDVALWERGGTLTSSERERENLIGILPAPANKLLNGLQEEPQSVIE